MKEEEIIEYFHQKDITELQQMTIGLVGDLGVGNTWFTKKFLMQISKEFLNQVSSPTYNICNIYQIPGFEVHHFDLYRIEAEEALYETEIWESIENRKSLTLIEWVDLFPDLMKKCDKIIKIVREKDDSRFFSVTP